MAKKPPTAARTWVGPDQLAPLLVPLAELSHDPRNARAHDERSIDAVQASLGAYGQVKPIVADAQGRIIAGNGTFTAAQALGWSHLAVVRFTGTPAQATAYGIADNRTAELSTWDEDVLAELLVELADAGTPAELPVGFTDDEVASFLPGEAAPTDGTAGAPPSVVEDEAPVDRAEELREKWGTASGQIWEIPSRAGAWVHRILCGDSTSARDFERLMAGEQATMLHTDPPYGVDVAGGRHDPRDTKNYRSGGKVANDALSDGDLETLLRASLGNCARVMPPGAAFYVWHPSSKLALFARCVAEVLAPHRQVVVWTKTHFVFGRQDYHWQHEPCFYGWLPGAAHTWVGSRNQSTVWSAPPIGADLEKKLHPTAKPLFLPARAVANHTSAGDLVLEPFSGSGSTLLACEQIGRRCFAMELEPKYVAVALERLARIGLVPKLCEKPEDLD